jgi:Ca2+-binding RTX toxin-like protein
MLPDNIENGSIMQASAGGIELIGNVLGNFLAGEGDGGYVLRGGAGNDRLATNGGANQLFGGEGDDTYQTWGHDLIVEAFGEGYDTVQVALSSSYTLPANIERLENAPEWAGGNPNATLTGNELDNFILGGRTIYGLAGNDTLIGTGMIGGLGDDTYIAGAGSTVLENAGEGKDTVEFQGSVFDASYFLSDNVENLTLRHGFGGEDGFGNDLDNVIIGNDSNNQLFGAGGNDLLSGGAGADFMDGGLGNDTFIVDNVADDVSDDPQPEAGIDTVEASVSYSLSAGINRYVENLTLTGDTAINGTGNGLDNTIIGNNASNTLTGGFGNDLLDGRGGADTMIGGSGDDTYVVDSFGDVVTEQSNDGTDTVNSYIDYSLTSRPNIEHLNLLGTAVSGTGNANDNRLIGNIIGNTLVGAGGNDTLIGGEGNDFLVGQLGSDTYQVNRGEGQDTILENASTPGDSDTLLYGATINPVDVVLSRQVNDLRLSIHGGADQVTIQSWYTNSNSQVETIQAGNGQILLSTQVDQLIQAMAQFTTDTGLSWDAAAGGAGTVQQQAQFQGILAANWQSVGS